MVGGRLLDWRRCLALYLWYASPSADRMKLPPEEMSGKAKHADMFADPNTKLRLSLQGAILYYLSKCWEGRARRKTERNQQQSVPHPWPAYAEEDGRGQPLHLVRKLVHGGPDEPCARMPPAVRARLGWSMTDKPEMPGRGALRAPAGDAAAQGGAHVYWEGWAVDVRLELASLLFPTGLGGDTSLTRLLETETNSLLGLDTELSWHLHELLLRLARLGRVGGKSAGKLAERLSAYTNASGHLLTHHQRSLLTQQFAAQLEMSGSWQAAAYVLLAFAPAPSADANMSATEEEERADADARQEAAQALRVLISRHPSPAHNVLQEPEIVYHGVGNRPAIRLTVNMIAERLQQKREEVLGWFWQSQAWALRTSFDGSPYGARPGERSKDGPVRRLRADRGLDGELELCMHSGEWLRANHLVLTLITPSDLPDPNVAHQPPKEILQLLRKLENGLSQFRRTHEWCHPPKLNAILQCTTSISCPCLTVTLFGGPSSPRSALAPAFVERKRRRSWSGYVCDRV